MAKASTENEVAQMKWVRSFSYDDSYRSFSSDSWVSCFSNDDKYRSFSSEQWVVSTLCLLYFVLLILLWGRLGSPIVDTGMEAYYAMHISRGGVYLRDFVALVPPLSLQLNGLLLYLFGAHLGVLYLAGATSGLLFVVCFYLTLRLVLPRALAFSVVLVAVLHTVLNGSIFNFIFPYCYAMPYASAAFITSLFLLLRSLRYADKECFWLSSLLFGVSVAFKSEFLFYGLVVLGVGWRKRFVDVYFLPLLGLVIALPTITSLTIEMIRGLSFAVSITKVLWVKKFASSPLLADFYHRQGVYSFADWVDLECALKHFGLLSLVLLLMVIVRSQNYPLALELIFLAIVAAFLGYTPWSASFSFVSLGPASLLLFGLLRLLTYSGKILPCSCTTVASISLLIGGLKTVLSPMFVGYGSNFLPFYLGSAVISLYGMVPQVSRIANRDSVSFAASVFLCLLSLVCFIQFNVPAFLKKDFTLNETHFRANQNHTYLDRYHQISMNRQLGKSMEMVMSKVARLRDGDSAMWVLPEGALMNFILDIPAFSEFLNVTPIFFETYGEESIINAISHQPPHFIVLNPSPRFEYVGREIIGQSYGQALKHKIDTVFCRVPLDEDSLLELLSSRFSDCKD